MDGNSVAGDSNHLLSSSGKPRAPEDTVFYAVFPDSPPGLPSDPAEVTTALKELQVSILDSLSRYTKDYIWQHEPFDLSVPENPAGKCICLPGNGRKSGPGESSSNWIVPHLHGKVRYGDNIEDEWFVVFLLYEISKRIPRVSIRVWDTDGELLLIEAAFSLPRWVNPENSSNRVFIRQGELHLIPRKKLSNPTLGESLKFLAESRCSETRAPDAVQETLARRISVYPERSHRNMHRVRCRVPLAVAQLLKHEPQLISMAVEGFYDRDIDSMRFAARMERFLSGGEMADVSVRMSKAMYAQLVQQTFQAPKCYPMPPRSEIEKYREAELGMKIACGFEMMYQQRKQLDPEISEQNERSGFGGFSDAFGDSGRENAWASFMNSLNQKGYFKGLLSGSKEYRRLMDEALDYYRSTSLFSKSREAISRPVRLIDEILSRIHSAEDFQGIDLPPSDDDSWLYNGEDELNSAFEERQKEMEMYELECKNRQNSKEQIYEVDKSERQFDGDDLSDVAKYMKAFVNKVSSYEGAVVPEKSDSKDVKVDLDHLMKAMESVMGSGYGEGTSHEAHLEERESSSDMELDDFDESCSDSEPPEAAGSADAFMESYSDALNHELKSSTLRKSFADSNNQSSANAASMTVQPNPAEDDGEDYTPVDVDINLVKSLLDSYSSQQGLPGPASNLLGLMGLQLPDNSADNE